MAYKYAQYKELPALNSALKVFKVMLLVGAKPTKKIGHVTRTSVGVFVAKRDFGGNLTKTFENSEFPINESAMFHDALRWACGGCDSIIPERYSWE